MKRLMFGILVAFGLVGLANAGDRLFSGEDLERYEDLKKRWEVIKESAKNTETFGECDKDPDSVNCSKYTEAKNDMELLEYADTKCGEIGCYKAREEATKKFKTLGFFNSDMSRNILKATENKMEFMEAKLMKIDALKSYNEFKAEMAKCRLSGKKCVEE